MKNGRAAFAQAEDPEAFFQKSIVINDGAYPPAYRFRAINAKYYA